MILLKSCPRTVFHDPDCLCAVLLHKGTAPHCQQAALGDSPAALGSLSRCADHQGSDLGHCTGYDLAGYMLLHLITYSYIFLQEDVRYKYLQKELRKEWKSFKVCYYI